MPNNIRLAFRSLRARPGFSLVIILMLAVGIGASTALFSLFYQVLMQPLNVSEPQRLVNLSTNGPKWGSRSCGFQDGCKYVFSYAMFRDLESRQTGFTGLAGYRWFSANLGYHDQTLTGTGMMVSGRYFSVLGLQPAAGRLIAPADEPSLGESGVAVITHEYWQDRFGGDPNIVNQTLMVNGAPLTIIGVAPRGFAGTMTGIHPQIFVPLTLAWKVRPTAAKNYDDRQAYWLYVFARPNPGTTLAQASTAINSLHSGLIKEFEVPVYKATPKDAMEQLVNQKVALEPGSRGLSVLPPTTGQALTLLLGITVLLLMIVCFNVANLLLARSAARAGEMAIRASIGGSRGQLIRQLMAESAVLSLLGGIASLPVATTTLDAIIAILPSQISTQLGAGISDLNPAAVAFAAGISLLTVFLFGLAPAVHATRIDAALTIKEHATQSVGGRRMARFRASLVTAQIALSIVLLVLAGLFAQSLRNVSRVKLGIDIDALVQFSVSPRSNGYTAEKTMAVFDRIEEEIGALPGVIGVTSSSTPLIASSGGGNNVTLAGSPPSDPGVYAVRNEVSPSFFKTVSIPLKAGRNFTDADTSSAPKVAIINESLARQLKLGNDAIGKHIAGYPYDNVRRVEVEIVGIVADAAYNEVKGEIPAQYFQPRRQSQEPNGLTYYVRAGVEPDSLLRAIPGVISRIDRTLPVNGVRTMRRQVQENVYVDRLVAILSAGFAALATLLAAIGLYGVLAYNVGQRTRELGLRLALGARPSQLRALVLKQVGLMALVGSVIGMAAAIALGRLSEALLFGLSGHDPRILAAALAALSVVVFLAGYVPARRASNISPMQALRYE